jgi:thiamine biosynthesis lipoprotein
VTAHSDDRAHQEVAHTNDAGHLKPFVMDFTKQLTAAKARAALANPLSRFLLHSVPYALLTLVLTARAGGHPDPTGLHRYEYSLTRMGTLARVVLYTRDEEQAQKAAGAVFDRIEDLEGRLSDYRDESELNRLTREAVERPQGVSPDLFYVLDQSQKFSRLSGGAFDITIGPVVRLWREARRAHRLPDAAELAKARGLVDYRNIEIDPATRTVMLKRHGMQLDLGGIAKGYAADQALELVQSQGIRIALVALGGDIRVSGKPPGTRGWKVAVENPDPQGQKNLCTLRLTEGAISTSGDTQQYLEIGGERISHIVNPASGVGLKDAASTTVIARDGTTADALATTLSVMPIEQGLRLVESVEGASAFVVRRAAHGFQYFHSRGFPPDCREPQKKE